MTVAKDTTKGQSRSAVWLLFGLIFLLTGYGPFLFGGINPHVPLTVPFICAVAGAYCLFIAAGLKLKDKETK